VRTRGIQVSVIEPAYTKTRFDANSLEPDSKLDEYSEVRAALSDRMSEVLATADEPGVVADVVLQAAIAARPRLRYVAGGPGTPPTMAPQIRACRRSGRWNRRNLHLDTLMASLHRTPAPEGPRVGR